MFCSFKNGRFLCWGEDFPPSVNAVYRVGKRRVYKPAVVADWKTSLFCAVRELGVVTPIFSKSPIYSLFCWWDDKSDIDNRLKPTIDAMKDIVFTDDSQLVGLSSIKLQGKRGFLFCISLKPVLESLRKLQKFSSHEELLNHINNKGVL